MPSWSELAAQEATQPPWGWAPGSHTTPGSPEWLPGRAVRDVPGEGTSQPLRRTHAWPGLPGRTKIGHPRQLAAPVSDREAGGELHARLSITSPAHGRLAATAESRPPALPSCHPPHYRPRALLSPLPQRQEGNGEVSQTLFRSSQPPNPPTLQSQP